MSSYTITIAADDPSQATMVLKVKLSGKTARLVEQLVRAGEGSGLTTDRIPAVDLDLLLKAVTPAAGGPETLIVSPAAAADVPTDSARPVIEDEELVADAKNDQAVEAPTPVEAPMPAEDEPATTIPAKDDAVEVAVPKQATRKKASTVGVVRPGGRKAATGAKATNAARKSGKQTSKGEASEDKGRAYRRSPGDLEAVYQQAGSVTAVADHYNVPRHTAQGWIRTLRLRQARSAE